MSAYGYKRTFTHTVIYVRFTPESRHRDGCRFTSANDPKRKFDTPSQNNRIRTPRRSLEGPNLLERMSRCSPRNAGPSSAYGGAHGFGERGIGASNVDRTVGNMCTEIPNAVFFFSKNHKILLHFPLIPVPIRCA